MTKRKTPTGTEILTSASMTLHTPGRYVREYKGQFSKLSKIYKELDKEDDELKLDVLPEATMLRAMAQFLLDKYDEIVSALLEWNALESFYAREEKRPAIKHSIPKLSEIQSLLEAASNIVDKIHKQREKRSITVKEYERLQRAQAMAVREAFKIHKHKVPEDLAEEITMDIAKAWKSLRISNR